MQKSLRERAIAWVAGRPPWQQASVVALAIATVLGWFSVGWVYFGMLSVGKPLTVRHALLAGLPEWYFWALLTPAVFWLGQRYRVSTRDWSPIIVHIAAGTAVTLGELLVLTTFNHFFYSSPYNEVFEFWDGYYRNILRFFHFEFIIYWLIVVAAHAFVFYRETRERALKAAQLSERNAQLESDLARAQLDSLKSQLQPHFLFNALNAVAALVRAREHENATVLLSRLGMLLRRLLTLGERDEVTLGEELEFVNAYLAIEHARFRERLSANVEVDPCLLDLHVPTMVLQPLVENAVRHGISSLPGAGTISIRARKLGAHLLLQVHDNGPGVKEPRAAPGANVGLANTRARLHRLYGNDCRFEAGNAHNGGFVASVWIPQRELAQGAT